ncbi:MAG: YraN family protein [bacterium]|nr:YraN family protein [bacterium]
MFGNWWNKLFWNRRVTPARKLGNAGEDVAARYLEGVGMRIVERNWQAKFGELDIICMEKDVVVFIEVKSAGKVTSFLPENRVNHDKQQRIKRLARAYLRRRRWDLPIRFDIVTVVWEGDRPEINHIINAFS